MTTNNPSEQRVSVETKEQKESTPEQANGVDRVHPFESAQLVIEMIEKNTADFGQAAEKIQSFPWVESGVEITRLQEAATESIHAYDELAKKLQQEAMEKLQTAVEQELASSELLESTEDQFFDRDLFIKEYAKYKKTVEEGGRNIGLYRFKDRFVKLVQLRRSLGQDKLTVLKDRTKDLEQVFVPDEILELDSKTRALVMPLAEGIIGNKLTKEDIEAVPDEHWQAFEATIRTLSERGIPTDLTKRSNFIYDKIKGFQFIDLENMTADGTSTKKFVEKDGKPHYFPFEHFRLFPKEYKGAKAMFEDIAVSQE